MRAQSMGVAASPIKFINGLHIVLNIPIPTSCLQHPDHQKNFGSATGLHTSPAVRPRRNRSALRPLAVHQVVQPVCTNAHVMRPGAPSLAVDGSEEIGLFVAAMDSLYLRLPYNKHLVLVKNLFVLNRCHPAALETALW